MAAFSLFQKTTRSNVIALLEKLSQLFFLFSLIRDESICNTFSDNTSFLIAIIAIFRRLC